MPADDDDRRLGNVGLTDDASVLGNMKRAGTGGFGGGGLGAPRTNISRGKRKELIPVDEEDRRMGNADLMANENQLEHTTHFKRRGTPFMTPAQKESLKDADEDEKMGLHTLDSPALMTGGTLQQTQTSIVDNSAEKRSEPGTAVKTSRPRGPKKKPPIQRGHDGQTGHHRQAAKGTFCKNSSNPRQ